MADFVKFSVPKELAEKELEVVALAKKSGKIRIGVNETTKVIERGIAKLVVIAEDVSPAEIVMHLPILCEEKGIAYGFVPTKLDLGKKAGIGVGTAAIAITEEGEAKKALDEVTKKLRELKK